jgi:hypothetical protein
MFHELFEHNRILIYLLTSSIIVYLTQPYQKLHNDTLMQFLIQPYLKITKIHRVELINLVSIMIVFVSSMIKIIYLVM